MEILQAWLDASDMPAITAFLLGLLTATSPCPLATNITAIGFISKDIEDKQRILLHGILYAIGRIVAYSLLGILLIYMLRGGIDTFNLQSSISRWGELLVAPLLLIIGVLMLVDVRMPLSKLGFGVSDRAERLRGKCGAFVQRVDCFTLECSFPCLLQLPEAMFYLSFMLWLQDCLWWVWHG